MKTRAQAAVAIAALYAALALGLVWLGTSRDEASYRAWETVHRADLGNVGYVEGMEARRRWAEANPSPRPRWEWTKAAAIRAGAIGTAVLLAWIVWPRKAKV